MIQEKFYAPNFNNGMSHEQILQTEKCLWASFLKKNKYRHMKQTISILALLLIFSVASAQYNNEQNNTSKGFDKSNLFTGGAVALSLGTGYFTGGVSPYLGYSVNKWLDLAVCASYNYTSQNDGTGNILRQTQFGPGAFVRAFPVRFVYGQAQLEENFLKEKGISAGITSYKSNVSATSLLVGIGYASGHEENNNSYYYISISYDMLNDPNSPYIDIYGRKIPVFKAGLNIALFQGHYRH